VAVSIVVYPNTIQDYLRQLVGSIPANTLFSLQYADTPGRSVWTDRVSGFLKETHYSTRRERD